DLIAAAKISLGNAANTPNRLAVVSLRQIRQYLGRHREPLADAISKQQSTPRAEVAAGFDKILMAIELFDRLELINDSTRPGEMKLTLRISLIQPLVK